MTKNSNFKTFTASPLTLSARRAAGSTTGCCNVVCWQNPLLCTYMVRAYKKQYFFGQNWMKFLKMLVL